MREQSFALDDLSFDSQLVQISTIMCEGPEVTLNDILKLRMAHPRIFVHQRLRDELAELHLRVSFVFLSVYAPHFNSCASERGQV